MSETLSEGAPAGFDTRVHIRDPKTGRLVKIQDYRLTKSKARDGNVVGYYERDGKKYWENGEETTDAAIASALGVPSLPEKTLGEILAEQPKPVQAQAEQFKKPINAA